MTQKPDSPQNPPSPRRAGIVVDGVEMTRINALIPSSEHQKLKIHAAKNQTSISELLREFVKKIPD